MRENSPAFRGGGLIRACAGTETFYVVVVK